MKIATKINATVFGVMLAIPLIAEFGAATAGKDPGTGIDVLLYEPFEFAYVGLTFTILVAANIKISKSLNLSMWNGVGMAFLMLILWFVVSFLCVVQLHISLGGQL